MEPLASFCCCCWCRVRIFNVHRDLPVGPPRSILDKAAGFSQQPSTMGGFAAQGCSDFLRCWGELESISVYHALEGAKVLGNWVHLGRVCLTLKPQEREAVSIFLKFCMRTSAGTHACTIRETIQKHSVDQEGFSKATPLWLTVIENMYIYFNSSNSYLFAYYLLYAIHCCKHLICIKILNQC